MESHVFLELFLLLLVAASHPAQSSRILAVFPHIGKSHFFVFEPFLQELASRGHDVHVISHFPRDLPLAGYHDISVQGSLPPDQALGGVSFAVFSRRPTLLTALETPATLARHGVDSCRAVLSFPSVQRLVNSDLTFDLVFTELFNTECFLGLVHRFHAPHIALSSCALMPWANQRFGNPDSPGYVPNIMAAFSDRMTFSERLENTLLHLLTGPLYHVTSARPAQQIAAHFFGPTMPPLEDIARNTSLILVNTHATLNKPRPLSPSVIEVGGIHVRPPKKLSEDLDAWLNDATDGVVFFSMGSMLRAETLPADKVAALVAAFGALPQRVLWKWEGGRVEGQPSNVRTDKWLPQRDVLAHPKVRVFVTHCGLLGTIEAVMSGVPMVGIPMYGDQHTNFRAAESLGVAVKLDYHDITKETVLGAIRTVLHNASYHEAAERLSRQYLDRPTSPMATAVFWTEYVIRHAGAPHLRPASVHLAWYQYLLLDVALVVAVGAAVSVAGVVLTARRMAARVKRLRGQQRDEKRKQL